MQWREISFSQYNPSPLSPSSLSSPFSSSSRSEWRSRGFEGRTRYQGGSGSRGQQQLTARNRCKVVREERREEEEGGGRSQRYAEFLSC